jgi:glycosyltransferase involved in cell wall biosynthesis
MKIVHFLTSLNFGGLERRMEILSHYPGDENDLVFCAIGGGGACYEKLVANGSRVILLNQDISSFNIRALLSVLIFLVREKPSVIHCHGAEGNFYGLIAGFLVGTRLRIAEEIGIPRYSKKSKFVFREIYKLSHRVIAMSPIVREFLSRSGVIELSKIDCVYNPVLFPKNLKLKNRYSRIIRFGFLGRLESVKNPDGLLRAFKMLRDNHIDVELHIIGDGSMLKCLCDFVKENGLKNHVIFYGFSPDPFSILQDIDVVVQPSHTEGFSLALVESMGFGIAALSTPVGGAREIIIESKGGWIANSSSDNDLYQGLLQVITDSDSIEKRGCSAAKYVRDKYDAASYATKLNAYYKDFLRKDT